MSTSTGLLQVKRRLSNGEFLPYFITGERNYSFEELHQIFAHSNPALVCFRRLTPVEEGEIIQFLSWVTQLGGVPILHYRNWFPGAEEWTAGVHLPSSQLELAPRFRERGLIVIGSTHSIEEVKRGGGCHFITFSPIFDSKGRKGLGVRVLDEVAKYHSAIFGLGGVVGEREVELLKNSPAIGFASIRYFHRYL
jgi:thiamine-phosphate pyrophosphorylase